tara:strand:+ start:2082 stop:2831 length:750 start_codon:yes stop_codon:yes gene_type:complete
MDNHDILKIGISAVKEAYKILSSSKFSSKIINKTYHDVKIQGDLESEKVIINYLTSKTQFKVLSEESYNDVDYRDDYYWIVDPIDGSVNYSRKIPFYAISVGLWKKNEPILGIIYDPSNDDLYTGIVNEGAWLNSKKIKVSSCNILSNAIMATGFPVSSSFSKKNILEFVDLVKSCHKVRIFGSAALSLSLLSSGKLDSYLENNIKIWDVAAGIAIVKAAGGCFEIKKSNHNHIISLKAASTKNLLNSI